MMPRTIPLLCCRFTLKCEAPVVDPDEDDYGSDYGYGGGSYDRGYGRDSYDRDYDRGYGGGGYKHHNKNYTSYSKRHDYEEYGGYRRRLQATVEEIGECKLTGVTDVGIDIVFEAATKTYDAQVSGRW